MNNNDKREIISSELSKITLHSAGEKEIGFDRPIASRKNKMYYPSLHLNIKQVPELKGMEVEDNVMMVVKGKITGHRLNENIENSNDTYTIDVLKIGVVKK